MIAKHIEAITQQDISALVENAVPEGKTIEYKLQAPGNTDGDKKEFLADVSSFPNATGGDLLFGIEEADGVPTAVPGLAGIDMDALKLRLEQILRDGVAPRIQGIQMRAIEGFPQGPVLLVRFPKSWIAPHMITFGGSSRFFTRNNAGKHQMDVSEIRSAFAVSESLSDRIARFRDERLGRIISDETPVPLMHFPKVILHVIPFTAFTIGTNVPPVTMEERQAQLQPLGGGSTGKRYNVDGFLTFSAPCQGQAGCRDYCQMFRTGAIEAVDAELLEPNGEHRFIANVELEGRIIDAIGRYVQAYQSMNISPPFVIMASFVGVRGYSMPLNPRLRRLGGTSIDRDTLILPDVILQEWNAAIDVVLRPIFDAMWNAAGIHMCLNYSENGRWNRDFQR